MKTKIHILLAALILIGFLSTVFSQGLLESNVTISTHGIVQEIQTETYSYIVGSSGLNYYAKNVTTGEIDYQSTNAGYVILSASSSNETVYIQPGDYRLTNNIGLNFIGLTDFSIVGSNETVFDYDYTGSLPLGDMLEFNNCTNCTASNLILNMNSQNNYSDLVDPGTTWIASATNTSNIFFDSIQFLNSPDCGFVCSSSTNVHISNSIFNETGEHPIYTNAGLNGFYVENTYFYNWAKWIRGYIKLTLGNDIHFTNDYFQPNQDGQGYNNSLGIGSGAAGIVNDRSNGVYIDGCTFVGSGTEGKPAIYQPSTGNNFACNNLNITNWNCITFGTQDSTSNYGSLTNSYLYQTPVLGFPMYMSNVTVDDPLTYNDDCISNSTLQDVSFIYRTGIQDYPVLILDSVSDVLVDNVNFIGWHFRGIAAQTSTNCAITYCNFDEGFSSWAIQGSGKNLTMQNNFFANVTIFGTYTIYLQGGSGNILEDNTFGSGLNWNIDSTYASYIGNNTF